MTLRLAIGSSVEDIAQAQEQLHAFLEAGGASARGVYRAELVLDELVTNVIKYAYSGAPGERTVDFAASIEGNAIRVVVEDRGPPFNPLDAGSFSPATSLEEARTGGYGLALVRMAATKMEYEREHDRNRVIVTIPRD